MSVRANGWTPIRRISDAESSSTFESELRKATAPKMSIDPPWSANVPLATGSSLKVEKVWSIPSSPMCGAVIDRAPLAANEIA